MTTATADRPLVTEAPSERRGLGARLASGLGKAPVHLLLIFVGLLWLVPTFGLFISSFRFREPVFNLYRASLPFAVLMFLALVLITYFPFLSLWLVHLLGR